MPDGFNAKLVLNAMYLITRCSVFELGDTFLKQLSGTGVRRNGCANSLLYAVIYYAVHEIFRLLQKYKRHLLNYGRFINDGFDAWDEIGRAHV